MEIVFATSNTRISKVLSAGEVFWLGSGGRSETVMEKFDLHSRNGKMASPRLLKNVYLSLLFVYLSELQ